MTATEAATQATVERAAVVAPPEVGRLRTFFANPWGKPRFLSIWTWLYIIWSIAPVLIAVQFSFNAGRSRSTFQGFSTQWYEAIWNEASENFDETLLPALVQSLKLALLTMPIATALGVGLAIGLARWRGRGSGSANFLMLFPLVTPEIVMGASMFLIFSNLYHFQLGTAAPAPRPRHVLDLLRRDRDEGAIVRDRRRLRGSGDGSRRVARGGASDAS